MKFSAKSQFPISGYVDVDIVKDSMVLVLFGKYLHKESFCYAWESCSVSRVPESHLADTSLLAQLPASLALWDMSSAPAEDFQRSPSRILCQLGLW